MFAYNHPGGLPAGKVTSVIRGMGKVEEIPVVARERSGGVSSISMTKSVYYSDKGDNGDPHWSVSESEETGDEY